MHSNNYTQKLKQETVDVISRFLKYDPVIDIRNFSELFNVLCKHFPVFLHNTY